MQDPRTEAVLKALSVKFTYEAEADLSKLVSDPDTQVRLPENRAVRTEVRRYADFMRNGAEFPPIVALRGGQIADGNTRFEAYARMGRKSVPVYWLDTASPAIAKRISVELNAVNGKRMEKEELARWLADGNGSIPEADAQRITGWKPDAIREARNALQFEKRRTQLGVALDVALPQAVRAKLNGVDNPDVFREMTVLAADAGFSASEANQLVKKVNETAKTDIPAALLAVSEARADNAQRIEERAAGLRVTTPLFTQLALHAGWMTKQGATGLHDTNKYTAEKSQALLEQVRAVIDEALGKYKGA
jgi:ParB-like chromosome segregation protein Spo0J